MYGYSGNDYRVATLSKSDLTTTENVALNNDSSIKLYAKLKILNL